MPALCLKQHMKVNRELIPKSKFNIHNKPISCVGSRFSYHCLRGGDYPVVVTHLNCSCNELLAFSNRHMVHDPLCSEDGKSFRYFLHNNNNLNLVLKSLIDKLDVGTEVQLMDMNEIIKKYHGRFRRKYIRAMNFLEKYEITDKHFINQCFLKDDKYHQKDLDTNFKLKAPRAIQYQSPEATLLKARLVIPVEKLLYDLVDVHGMRVFTKGLNQIDVANLMIKGHNSIHNPVCIENDYSSFDAHVNVQWLKISHKFMLHFCPPVYRRDYALYFKKDYNVRGYTATGIAYKIVGTLTSGSIDTSLKGNLINFIIVTSIMKRINCQEKHYKFICNGDDSVLFINKDYLKAYMAIDFKEYGMDAKVIVKDNLFDVEFCQSKLVKTPIGFNMVRDPNRMFTRIGWMMQKRCKKYISSYIKTVIMGEMALNYMVPVVYPILYQMYNHMDKKIKLIRMDTYVDTIYRQERHWEYNVKYEHPASFDRYLYAAYPNFEPFCPKQFMSNVDVHKDNNAYDLLLSTIPIEKFGGDH